MDQFVKTRAPSEGTGRGSKLLRTLSDQKYLFGMSMPFVVWVFVFAYIPIWGWVLAFTNFKIPGPNQGFFDNTTWVGLKQFEILFQDESFWRALVNTLGQSVLLLIFGFTIPVIFAILLNEIRATWFKRSVQTISYLPHFVAWVVVAAIVYQMLSSEGGVINEILVALGIQGRNDISVIAKESWFWGVLVSADLWKEVGWNSIIYIAAISGIDPELYEAAKVDGAGRFRQIWHITLPGIRGLIVVLLVLSIGNIISIGFERQMLLGNPRVIDSYMVLDLYALQTIRSFRFALGTAIGIFKSGVSLILLFSANGLFKKFSGESVM